MDITEDVIQEVKKKRRSPPCKEKVRPGPDLILAAQVSGPNAGF